MTPTAVCLTLPEIQCWLCQPLTFAQRNRFYGHLRACQPCRATVHEYHELDRLCRGQTPDEPLRVQGYGMQRCLGRGRCSDTWLAVRESDARPCVLKFVRRDRLSDAALEELLCWPDLAGSPEDPFLVLVGDYLPGGSLLARKKIPREDAVKLIAAAAAALMEIPSTSPQPQPDWYDIHPGNVLLDEGGQVVLDWGLSRWVDDGLYRGWSLGYAAPEALEGAATERSAVFSLAACLVYLLTGEPPFCPDDRESYLDAVRAGLPWCQQLEGLTALLEQGLSFEPANRPSLEDFQQALQALATQSLLAETLHRQVIRVHSPVNLQVTISVADPHKRDFQPLLRSSSRSQTPAPEEVHARTGDLIRIDASSDTDGYLTVLVFNANGESELLMPSEQIRDHHLPPGQNRRLTVQLRPPGGIDHTALVWTRQPLLLNAAEWSRRILSGQVAQTRPALLTRGSAWSAQELASVGDDWTALVLRVNHQEDQSRN